jgi:Tfp pilus assembly protein PilF
MIVPIQAIRHVGSSVQPEQSRPPAPDESGSVLEHKLGWWRGRREGLGEQYSANEHNAVEQKPYSDAEHVLHVAIEQAEQIGSLNPRLADGLNELGMLYAKQHKYAQAEQLFQCALGVMVAALGPDHPDVAILLKNIGILKASQREYVEADLLLRQALLQTNRVLGREHPTVAATMRTIAVCQAIQGHHGEAERFIRRSLDIGEKTLGPEHSEVAASSRVLAQILCAVDRNIRAYRTESRTQDMRTKCVATTKRM